MLRCAMLFVKRYAFKLAVYYLEFYDYTAINIKESFLYGSLWQYLHLNKTTFIDKPAIITKRNKTSILGPLLFIVYFKSINALIIQ